MRTFKIEKTDTQCVVTWWYFSGAAVFLFVFFAFQTVVIGLATWELFVKPSIFWFFFMLPFWAVWCVVLAVFTDAPFGKTRLVLHKNGLEIRWTWFFIKRKKRYDLANVRSFRREVNRAIASAHGLPLYGYTSYSLRIVRQVGEISFRVPSGKEELKKLCSQLNAFLNKLKSTRAAEVSLLVD